MRVEDLENYNFDNVGNDLKEAYANGYNDGYAYARGETTREIFAKLQGYYHLPSDTIIIDINDFYKLAKEYGLEE